MSDLMRHGRMLAEACRERSRLERELSIVNARINTLTAEIMSVTDEPAPDETVSNLDVTQVLQTVRPYVSGSPVYLAAENRERGRGETFALTPIADRIANCPAGCTEISRHVHTPNGHTVSVIRS